jgi:UDP-4-amino-4,6-dideoxy-N-acetyl-beta-L-altrosamine transaminase
MIPYARQSIDDDDIAAVVDVLRAEFLTQGPTVEIFEKHVAEYVGASHAVAVSNGTAALHVACAALGIGPGDLVWTTPNSFVASANCARYCGADVDFVDVDQNSYNISPQRLADKLKVSAKTGRVPKAVVIVDYAGQPCDLAPIADLSKRYEFRIIEDAAHGIGARYRGDRIGNGRYSDITTFSFHPVKIITTAEGGMAVTEDPDLARRMARLRSHGITRNPSEMESASPGAWYYEQIELGWNYRLTDVLAALGIAQLSRIEIFLARRREIARLYDELLADLPLVRPWQHPETQSAFHLYPIRVKKQAQLDRASTFLALRAAGILVNVHYIPIHLQPYYRKLGFMPGDFSEAEAFYSEVITLPMYASLTDSEITKVVTTLQRTLRPKQGSMK